MQSTKTSRRYFLKSIGAACSALALPGCANLVWGEKSGAKRKPNVVLILVDDMGWTDLGCFGSRYYETPNIDKLAAGGMKFTNGYAACAVCSPTRYGVLTGRYSWRTRLKRGIVNKWERPLIDKDKLTVGKMLQQCGYRTACIGKWHLGWNWLDRNGKPTEKLEEIDFSKPVKGGPIKRGFDYYFGDDVPNWPPYVWIENDRLQGIPVDVMEKDGSNGVSPHFSQFH